MEIIDQHDSVLEEPFPGNNSPGENKLDAEIEEQTDSTATNEEEKRVEKNQEVVAKSSETSSEALPPDSPDEQLSGKVDPEDKSAEITVTPDGEDHPEPTDEEPVADAGDKQITETVATSVEVHAASASDDPIDTPTKEPADTPAEEPAATITEDTVEAKAEEPADTPAEEPAATITEDTVEAKAEEPVDTKALDTDTASTKEPVPLTTEESASGTTEEPADATGDKAVDIKTKEPTATKAVDPTATKAADPTATKAPETAPTTTRGEFAEFDYSTLSREDLVNRLKHLLEFQSVQAIMTDVDNIKLNFYKKFKLETEAKRKKFVEEGGRIEDFKTPEDNLEKEIKEQFIKFRERKTDFNRNLEQQKQENLKLKYEVIEKIKDLVNRKESINKTFNEFRDLQREWRTIGLVPQASLKDMWETYHYHVEKFYDFIKINKELRDLDLKKNLEAKISLCENAEELILEPSVVNAFKTLQKFHDQWREIGPVPMDKRTEIWTRFKEATYKINSRHQQHFEDLKKSQKKNLEQKEILCEKAEDICNLVLKSHREWDDKSKELVELQKVWRTIGFAPKKDNTKIYQRFREACDTFFSRKREFYAQNKEIQLNNLQLKTELCIQAESLKESTEWRKTTEDLIRLQKKWKEIGPAPKKQSEQIWKRFRAACDHFFEQKSHYFKNIDKTYDTNLKLKESLIEEIEAFKTTDNIENNFKKLNEFQRKWTEIGFVPIKEKEALQDKYRNAINKHFDSLKIDDQQKNMLKFRNRLNNLVQKPNVGVKLSQEREKYVARLQQLRGDIVLWENNIGFFAKSKNAESMIQDVESKINSAKETIKMLEMKIDMIDKADSED